MAAAAALVDAILESDRKAPRKQRHTARRIYEPPLSEPIARHSGTSLTQSRWNSSTCAFLRSERPQLDWNSQR